MRILAIDPSTKIGFAFFDGEKYKYETWNLGAKNSWGQRLSIFYYLLVAKIEWGEPELIAVESLPFSAHPRDTLAQRYIGIVLLLAYQYKIEVVEVNPSSWKAAVGGGRMKPAQYQKAVRVVMGVDPQTPDEAAALGMINWAKTRKGGG